MDGELVIGLVGRLDPMKGHDVFLEAAARLAIVRPDVKFVCVGDGPRALRTRLEVMTRKLGLTDRVSWLGGTKDVRSVYNGFDLMTSASLFGEGFPNVIGEAMACGVLCVVTDVGDSARVVGDTGIVVRKGDPAALVGGWLKGLDQLSETSRPDPRERIELEFDLEKLTDTTERVLTGLLARSGRTIG